jgi:DNA invertase Pin-like site-specific DNA recombinase
MYRLSQPYRVSEYSARSDLRPFPHQPPSRRQGYPKAGILNHIDPIDRIGKAGASFRSLGDPLWDTSSAQGRLLSTLLAGIAEFERELIRERTGEGRKRAMANGVKFGRKRKLSDYQRKEAIKRRAAGETLATIAKSYGVDLSMISRL